MRGRKVILKELEIEEEIGQVWTGNSYSNFYMDQFGNKIHWKMGIKNDYNLEQRGQGGMIKVYSLITAKHISKILLNDFIMHKDHNK